MSFKLSPVSPEKVKQLSSGEVRIDETLNFKNKLPVRDGLFCQKIFGPIKEYTCECGKYEGKKYAGKICENCGVSVISSRARSERMGHIDLQLPIVNPISKDAIVSIIDVKPGIFTSFLANKLSCYFEENVHTGNLVLKDGTRGKISFVKLDSNKLQSSNATYTEASIALYDIIEQVDVKASIEVNDNKLLKLYHKEKFLLTSLFLRYLPVSPPNYRSIVPMNGFYTTNSNNDLYLRVCRRSIRLKRLLQLNAIKHMICYENGLIYKAVHNLFFGNSFDGKGNELKGILKGISGKDGIVRKNLLGKRVDYSGRTAITSSGDRVDMDQLGLPRQMAYELFKPFIIAELLNTYAETYKEAIAIYKQKSHIAVKSMEKVVAERRVFMNRAPTLHRYGIMSFRVKLIEGKVILLHPLICVPFNADFDGDQVGIHVPLSDECLREADELMAPEHNILSSLDGQPQFNPSHEMVIGLDVMTRMKRKDRHSASVFNSLDRLDYLYSTNDAFGNRHLDINEEIQWRDERGTINTCYGRLLIEKTFRNKHLPDRFNKTTIKKLISVSYDFFEPKEFLKALDDIMKMSLNYVTLSGFSVASRDCTVPSSKSQKVEIAEKATKANETAFKDGLMTVEQKFEDNVRLWDNLIKDLQNDWKIEVPDDNAVKMMLTTGARVSMTQVSQLNIAKGLITDTSNRIKELPILNSLVEGLTTFDYFKSCSGSRKSMADKASLTPESGYLTRRMVTVSRDFYIVKDDCETHQGIVKEKRHASGRYTCDGEFIEENSSSSKVKIRTPLFCEAEKGICAKCYGINPATRKIATIGSNVGTIAAQSLTESTTQMTMKTFHTSGAAVVKDSPLVVKSAISGQVSISEEFFFNKIEVKNDTHIFTYYVDRNKARIYVKDGKELLEDDIIAVYTHEGLQNDDVSGSLPRVEALYEASVPTHSKECIIALESGLVKLVSNMSEVLIYIDDTLVGMTNGVPIFVADNEYVEKGKILTFGSPNVGKFYRETKDLAVAYQIFEAAILSICEKENIFPNPIHIELIFRCMSNLVMREDGLYGLRSHGDVGEIELLGIDKVSRVMPSWLKSIGYGYTKQTIKSSAIELRTTYDLSSEKLMYGGLIFDNREVV